MAEATKVAVWCVVGLLGHSHERRVIDEAMTRSWM